MDLEVLYDTEMLPHPVFDKKFAHMRRTTGVSQASIMFQKFTTEGTTSLTNIGVTTLAMNFIYTTTYTACTIIVRFTYCTSLIVRTLVMYV